jgi:hypothetical protein
MKSQNFSTAFTVHQTPEEAFAAINNVRGWWTGEPGIEGSTRKLGDEFSYRYNPHHYNKQKITDFIPGKKVVWLVLDSTLNLWMTRRSGRVRKLFLRSPQKGARPKSASPTQAWFRATNVMALTPTLGALTSTAACAA